MQPNSDVLALVLAGGNGSRLGALTRWECKPALSFAGQYRNIDFTLSNCLNSGLRRIAVLTQYKTQSLIEHVGAYAFVDEQGTPRYWRDVGTIPAYWQAHMELLGDPPPLDLHDPSWPIHSAAECLPPAHLCHGRSLRCHVESSMLAGGVIVRGASVSSSVLAIRAQVAEGSVVEESVVLPGARIGRNCRLRRVVVAAQAAVPDGTVLDGEEEAAVERHGRERIGLVTEEALSSALRSVA